MAQASKEPCKKEACDIQACLSKNNFLPQKSHGYGFVSSKWLGVTCNQLENGFVKLLRCLKVIELLDSCCAKCDYNSTHCASLSGLLKPKPKPKR